MAARFRHFTLTMTGAAIQLSSVFTTARDDEIGLRMIVLEGEVNNAAAINIGDSTVSATSWAFFVADVSALAGNRQPIMIYGGSEGALHLSDFWAHGTANDILHIGVLEY